MNELEMKNKLTELGLEKSKRAIEVTPEYIQKLEETIGVLLPEDYKRILYLFSSSYFFKQIRFPTLDIIPETGGRIGSINYMFGRCSGSYNLLVNFDFYLDRTPASVMPIGGIGGCLICLGIKDGVTGKVYYWDSDYESDGNPTFDNMYLIANSFEEFIRSMESQDDDIGI